MRPKSMATVVVRLSGTASASSIPIDAAVIACSVSSGGISESERTSVVLPTPNPPAINTFSGMSSSCSACTESLQQPFEDLGGGAAAAHRLRWQVHRQVTGVDQVADQDPRHTDGHAER